MGERVKELEVHEHSFIRGPRSHRTGDWPAHLSSTLRHSHGGGNAPHEHPDTGPASYTIDKDEWARKTGLKGGGRKQFTVKPTGEQFPLVPREPQFFDVFITDSALVADGNGGLRPIRPSDEIVDGGQIGDRMTQAFGLTARVHDLRTRQRKAKP